MRNAVELVLVLFAGHVHGWTPAEPAAQVVQNALNKAIATNGTRLFRLPAAALYFNDQAFNITHAGGIAVVGSGETTLYFAPGVGLRIQNSSDCVLRSFAVDYFPLPYVSAVVVSTPTASSGGKRAPSSAAAAAAAPATPSKSGGTSNVDGGKLSAEDTNPATSVSGSVFRVQLSEDSLTFDELKAQYPPHDTWPPVTAFSKGTTDYKRGIGNWGQPPSATLVAGTKREYDLPYSSQDLVVGDVITAATRTGFTITLSYTANITLQDVVIHAAGNMAITEFQGDGGNHYVNVSLVPRSPVAPLASNADGFHSSGMRHGPTLSSVTMLNLLDDYFNVHNTFQIVAQRAGPRSVLVGDYQYLSGDNTLYATQQTLSRVRAGESASFFPINTFTYPATASGTISSIARVTDPKLLPLLADAHAAAAKVAKAPPKTIPCSACKSGFNTYKAAQLYNITFAAKLPVAVKSLLLLNADNISNTNAVVESCSFAGSSSNLGRFKSSGGVLRGNVWRKGPTQQNLEIEPLQNWMEGMLGIHDILIENNVFAGTATSPVHINGATEVVQRNNTFLP